LLTLYREILQKYVPGFVWFIFNVTFISFIQSILLFLFASLPTYTILVSTQHEPNITTADIFYFLVEIALVFSEWISDGQQWSKLYPPLNSPERVQRLTSRRVPNCQVPV
jgi:steroid 5-alpha reductase family enzyme